MSDAGGSGSLTYRLFNEAWGKFEEISKLQNKKELFRLFSFVRTRTTRSEPIFVEIGSRRGFSFYVLSHVFPASRQPLLISIDLPAAKWGDNESVNSFEKVRTQLAKEDYNVYRITGSSHSLLTLDMLKSVLHSKIDFLFLDGDHSYSGIVQDYLMYSPLVKKHGIIAFHDIDWSAWGNDRDIEVPVFWQQLKLSTKDWFEFIQKDSQMGIGVVIKK